MNTRTILIAAVFAIQAASTFGQLKISKDQIAEIIKTTDAAIEPYEKKLKLIKKGKIRKTQKKDMTFERNRYSFKSRELRDAMYAETEKTVKELKAGDRYIVPLSEHRPKLGELCRFLRPGHCFQVISPTEMLVKTGYVGTSARTLDTSFDMFRVIKWNTAGLVDKGLANLSGTFIVSGTSTYQTLAGTNTVLVIEPFDTKELKKYR